MIIKGIKKTFSTINNVQYDFIGKFWDEISCKYGIENLLGIGYNWTENTIDYIIGLKVGDIIGFNAILELPDNGWEIVVGKTDELDKIYDNIYKNGVLKFEIETFDEDGNCEIRFIR